MQCEVALDDLGNAHRTLSRILVDVIGTRVNGNGRLMERVVPHSSASSWRPGAPIGLTSWSACYSSSPVLASSSADFAHGALQKKVDSDLILFPLQGDIQFWPFRCFVKHSWPMRLAICPGRSTENLFAMPSNVRTCWGRITGLWQPESLSCKTVDKL